MKEKIINEFLRWLDQEGLDINNPNAQNTAAVYIRVSTNKQEELSPISQLKEVYKYSVKNNYQLNVDYIFIEKEGISAKSAKNREEFQKMIAYAKAKEHYFDSILVWKFSRFARNQEESIVYKSMLKKSNVNVISVSEPIIEGPFGELIERILEWMDEYYLIRLSGEVTRGMTENAKKGIPQTYAPFGYRNKDKNYIIEDDEAEVVKWIFETFVNTNTSQIDMARHINSLGFKTKRGASFENRTINYILLNPVYIGKIRWTPNGKLTREELYNNNRSIIKKGTHEPIISEELFDQARKKLLENSKWRKPHEQVTSTPWHWLKGLVRCTCGKTFVRNSGKLRCNGANKGTCSVKDRLDVEEVEKLVLRQIKTDLSSEKINIEIVKKEKRIFDNNKEKILMVSLENLKKKSERCKNAYLNGIDNLEEYKENKLLIAEEKKKLEEQLNLLKNKNSNNKDQKQNIIREQLKNVYEILNDKHIEMVKKYDIAHKCINTIVYDNGTLYLKYNEF